MLRGVGVPVRERGQQLAAEPRRQARQQQAAARAAFQRQRLTWLERGAQVVGGLDAVHAHRGAGDEADEDHGLAAGVHELTHDRVGELDNGLGRLGGAGERDELGGQVIGAMVVTDEKPHITQ